MQKLALLASVAAMGLTGSIACAQSNAGLQEFVEACASCHGIAGHGDGPLAEYMSVEVPDLTQIAIANDGTFPMAEVIRIIDGRRGIRGHGSAMPIWGMRYAVELMPEEDINGTELLVRGRILALAQHLEAIQE